jgi:hypothetical protein
MTGLRTLMAAGGVAALLLLATARPADAQVVVHRGINPWTGKAYRNVMARDPWTGRVYRGGARTNPWTGTTVRGGRVYNPWTGRTTTAGAVYNPWTGQVHWGINTRRGW